jgi:hypothetical protein
MPRTPAPLTVNEEGGDWGLGWTVLADGLVIAKFIEEADARAFVALPALIDLLKRAATLIEYDPGAKLSDEIAAALAQVDSPSPTDS